MTREQQIRENLAKFDAACAVPSSSTTVTAPFVGWGDVRYVLELLDSARQQPLALRREKAGLEAQVKALHSVERDVEEFHLALDIPVGMTPKIRRPELRATLIEEEAQETAAAIRDGDLVGAIDGLCDLLCVVYGAAVEFGVELAPFWVEVHRSNMAKAGGPMREDGKRLKPAGWQPPDIAGVLALLDKRQTG